MQHKLSIILYDQSQQMKTLADALFFINTEKLNQITI